MIIFLNRIPADTKYEDIVDFLRPVLKGRLLKKSGNIHSVKILVLKDTIANKKEYHALVTIEPDKAGARAIRELNRKPINGKHIAVREYVYRNWQNDQRNYMHQLNEELTDRRLKGRRRGNKLEVVDKIVVKFSSRFGFHRI